MRVSTVTPFFRDKRGSTVVQFVLVLPVFIILVFGSYEIWKLVHLKQTLEAATIQATRFLSIEGRYLERFPDDWQWHAWNIISDELGNEPLLQDELEGAELWVEVDTQSGYGRPLCPDADRADDRRTAVREAEDAQFVVRTELRVSWPVRVPYLDAGDDDLTLSESHWRYTECYPTEDDDEPDSSSP